MAKAEEAKKKHQAKLEAERKTAKAK